MRTNTMLTVLASMALAVAAAAPMAAQGTDFDGTWQPTGTQASSRSSAVVAAVVPAAGARDAA